jgi:predicted amidohydrolase
MQTCYDLRFPEVTRRLIDAEADVVLASVGEEEGLGTVTLDAERIARLREMNPAIRLRRFSVVASMESVTELD